MGFEDFTALLFCNYYYPDLLINTTKNIIRG